MSGIERIAAERQRQIDKEGWTAEHDAHHRFQDLAAAAQCYAAHVRARAWLLDWPLCRDFGVPTAEEGQRMYREEPVPDDWPWEDEWWKPKDPERDLVRAGALLAAALDRLAFPPPARGTERSER